jgi:hypothetical protein
VLRLDMPSKSTSRSENLDCKVPVGVVGLTLTVKSGSTTGMEKCSERQAPFDERAALAELESVRERIEHYRAQRRKVQEEFDAFVRSFKTPLEVTGAAPAIAEPGQATAPDAPAWSPGRVQPPVPAELATFYPDFLSEPLTAADGSIAFASETEPPMAPAPTPQPLPSDAPAFEPECEPLRADEVPRATSRVRMIVGGGLVLLVGGGAVTWMLRSGESDPSGGSSPAPVTRSASPASDPMSDVVGGPAQAAAVPSADAAELTTIRRVWMRVLVDGERVLEREVPAETRVPLTAGRTVVVRTGDGGAVRFSLGGEDQGFLGREGEVVTRTFTVPTPVARYRQRGTGSDGAIGNHNVKVDPAPTRL